ncbi:hypothetical protein FF38_02917 [Lucilia cuprina]|uniref:Uncharacterized protein n=1 Tax=Lucilia cuprina TaxID=7375 RepID=A0A0L0CBL6_LUCCU|nr:hypothetical protein FF38_02917 [Lucilia cuprina]
MKLLLKIKKALNTIKHERMTPYLNNQRNHHHHRHPQQHHHQRPQQQQPTGSIEGGNLYLWINFNISQVLKFIQQQNIYRLNIVHKLCKFGTRQNHSCSMLKHRSNKLYGINKSVVVRVIAIKNMISSTSSSYNHNHHHQFMNLLFHSISLAFYYFIYLFIVIKATMLFIILGL